MFMTGGLHWYTSTDTIFTTRTEEGRSDRQPAYERLLGPWGNDADCFWYTKSCVLGSI